jgi:hypothetical protein
MCFPASSSVQVLWALSKLGYQPDAVWMGHTLSRMRALLRLLDPPGLTTVLHACMWMERLPSKAFLRVGAVCGRVEAWQT